MSTGIQWTDETWNAVTGCSKVSQGCKFCYAERLFPKVYPGRAFTDVRCHPDRLDKPLRWNRARMVFVNSMSDLFHDAVPEEFIDRIFAVMALCRQHTFQILTKRPERMREYMGKLQQREVPVSLAITRNPWWDSPQASPCAVGTIEDRIAEGPLPNVWLGVSVEDRATADERIPLLLQTPAAVRFLSYEPALGPVNLLNAQCGYDRQGYRKPLLTNDKLDWVICGGESGPHARPMHPDWARSVRDQCQTAGVPFFFKQWGEWAPGECADSPATHTERTATWFANKWSFDTLTPKQSEETHRDFEPDLFRLGKHNAGRLLDGREWNEYPNSLKGTACQTSTPQNSASKCSS